MKSINKNKKGIVILAGGKGSRLWPLTLLLPKPLLFVGFKKRMIHFVADLAKKENMDVFILVREKYKENFLRNLGKSFYFLIGNEGKETGGEVIQHAQTLLKMGKEQLVVAPADYYVNNIPFKDMFKKLDLGTDIVLLANKKRKNGEYLCLESGGFITKISKHSGTLSNVGVYGIKTKLMVDNRFISRKIHTTCLINELIDLGYKTSFVFDENEWIDIGTFKNYLFYVLKYNIRRIYENLFNKS